MSFDGLVRSIEPLPPTIGEASCLAWFVERLASLDGVHRWLVDHIAPAIP